MTTDQAKVAIDRYVVVRRWDGARAQWMLIAKHGPYTREQALQVKAGLAMNGTRAHIERDRSVYWAAYHRARWKADEVYRERRRKRSTGWHKEKMAFIRGEA